MSTFAATFRELVMPDLRRMCRLQALAVARGRCGFSDASNSVFAHARARGATHLPVSLIADNGQRRDLILELHDWIDVTILKTIADVESRPDAAREIVDETLEVVCPE